MHASAFVTLHAGDFGSASPRAVVYTFEPPASVETASPAPAGLPQLISWERVQELHLDSSRELGTAIEQALGAFRGLSVPKLTAAPARVLRSVNAPAVAIEIGSFAPDTDATLFTSSSFQQQLAGAILNGLDNFKKP